MPSPGVVLPPGVALGVACPGVTWLGVDSHILVLGVAPGVSEPGLCGVTPGVSEPFGRPGVSSHRLAEGVAICVLQTNIRKHYYVKSRKTLTLIMLVD